jgi:type IV pilus assembly protein PilY1
MQSPKGIDMRKLQCTRLIGAMTLIWGIHGGAMAQLIIEDTLTGASSSVQWRALSGACLTAGSGAGSIPKCDGLPYYNGKTQVGGSNTTGGNIGRLPDAVGKGALRLTNGDTQVGGDNGDFQNGAVVSDFVFPTNQGLEVTFTTVTYGGDNLNDHGADGISFYLSDGTKSPSVGGNGGSLGYSCSNGNNVFDGVAGGYIGVGIDEFGNFSNPGDTTNTGPGFQAGRISVRGAGDTNWASLNSRFPVLYPTSLNNDDRREAVQRTCRTGRLWNYSGAWQSVNGTWTNNRAETTQALTFNYPYITHSNLVLPAGVTSIANQQGLERPVRPDAIPVTYGLKISQDGLLDFTYSVNGGTPQTVISNQRITTSNGPLPPSFRFGFSSGTGGGNNVHEITCFKAAPVVEANSSAGTTIQPSARVEAGSQLFLAYFHPTNWWGQLTAQSLLIDSANDTLSISSAVNWDAHCTLTGGACNATNVANVTASVPNERKILTWNGVSSGIAFRWADLPALQKTALGSAESRLNYLRGDRTNELSNAGGLYRTRTGVLGDIINSSPTWVGSPSFPYGGAWTDGLFPTATMPENSGTGYAAFKVANATREHMVYSGANDGLLHAFRAGAFDSEGGFAPTVAKPNDGREALAYMPGAVLSTIHNSTTGTLDFSGAQYSHNFFVDGTPGTGDLYYNGAWHTWLVGGLGAGGNAAGPVANRSGTAVGVLYALDITDPSRFSEANASSLVLGEWASSTLTCTNAVACGNHFGSVYGKPTIRRFHNGKWGVLLGNGLNSASGKGGVFIMVVEPTSGARSFLFLDSGQGASGINKNGVVNATGADFDNDGVVDYVYAGDVLGNVWRFDVTSSNTANWAAAPYKLYSGSASEPITTSLTVASVFPSLAGEKPRLMVNFGTGQMFPQTATSAATYASGTQSLYGIWDSNMSSWNSKVPEAEKLETQAVAATATTVSSGNLQDQSVTSTLGGKGSASSMRLVSSNKVCFKDSTRCGSGNDKFGWRLPLPGASEQVIFNPTLVFNLLLVNTLIPGVSQALTCDSQPASGFTMAITAEEGVPAASSFFAGTDSSTDPGNTNNQIVAGLALGATGTPSVVTTKRRFYLLQQTKRGNSPPACLAGQVCSDPPPCIPGQTCPDPCPAGKICTLIPPTAGPGGRLNWKKIR